MAWQRTAQYVEELGGAVGAAHRAQDAVGADCSGKCSWCMMFGVWPSRR